MNEYMSEQELVELILQQGIKGRNNPIEAQECVYSYDYGALTPYMSDHWTGVYLGDSGYNGYVYGSATEPYFRCYPDKMGLKDGEPYISGYSVSVEVDIVDSTHAYLYGVFHPFDENNNPMETTRFGGLNILDFDLGTIDGYYLVPVAGYDDNNGNYFLQLGFGYTRRKWVSPTEYEDQLVFDGGGSLVAGDSLLHWCQYWAEGQQIIEEDGVTPTGGSGGGGGDFNRYDESVGIPSLPSINIADLGLCSIYHLTPQQLSDFSAYLWTPNGFIEEIIKNQNSPMENIISLSLVPTMAFSEASAEILIGNASSGVQAKKLMTTFYEIDCGTINVTEYYKNFADYRTELQIYLPFIGIRDIPINDAMKGTIKVVYHVDVFSGSCVAFIQCRNHDGAWHVLQSHNGSIACQIPLSGANYMGVYQGILGAVGSVVSFNPMGMVNSVMNAKPSYQRSGNIGSTSGLMSIRYPYLMFTTPQLFTPSTFRQDCGYISNVSGTLWSFHNDLDVNPQFIQIDTSKLDLNGLVITEEERSMLYDLLNEGIYI